MKTKYLFIGLALACVFCACSRDEESLFDKSASERAQEALDNANEVLIAPANGWEMIYFANTASRGYNIILKFDKNGRVTATAKNATTTKNKMLTDSLSTWQVKLDYGPILTFDTYNDVFHAWADPQDDGDGLLGDYEFLILSATKDKVLLKGKKHSAYGILRPMPEMDPETYFNTCNGLLANYFGNGNIVTLTQKDGKSYLHNGSTGLFTLSAWGEKASTEEPEEYPLCATLDGFVVSFGFSDETWNERIYTLDGTRFVGEQGSIISVDDLNQLYMTYIDVNKGWTANLTSSTGAFAEAVTAFQGQLVTLSGDTKAKITSVGITYSDTVYRYQGSYLLRVKYEYKKSGSKQTLSADFAVNVSNTEKPGNIVITFGEPLNGTASTWYANEKASELKNLVHAAMGTFTLSADGAINPAKEMKMSNGESDLIVSGSLNMK